MNEPDDQTMISAQASALRPALSEGLSIAEFRAWYWHSTELKAFCRSVGIDGDCPKLEINRRIEAYLGGAPIIRHAPPAKGTSAPKQAVVGELSDDTLIPENVLLSAELRAYFEARVSGKFRFSKELIQFLRENAGKRLVDALRFFQQYKKAKPLKKSGESIIPPQCQYNQFVRDFLADNPDQGFKDAVAAWNLIRQGRGDFKYQPKSSETVD